MKHEIIEPKIEQENGGENVNPNVNVEEEEEVEFIAPEIPDLVGFKEAFTKLTVQLPLKEEVKKEEPKPKIKVDTKLLMAESDSDSDQDVQTSSKRKKRVEGRISVAGLKGLVRRPEVVDFWDTCSPDPKLLVFLKAYRNTVMIPRHWNSKRKYMANKRGVEKPPFKLPEYIESTGIAKIRMAIQEKETEKSMRQRQREKAHPKAGKLDIDYQVLHDAFFKYQTKPALTGFSDMYFEGKEFEVKMSAKKPGNLSEDLRLALGMSDNTPAPWLINMQRYGPPPAYPRMRIPGLNAPIPAGCEYGYHPGGWGKPPVDEFGNPLYGTWTEQDEQADEEFWGEVEEMEEESDDEEDDEHEGTATPMVGTPIQGGVDTPMLSADGSMSSSGIASVTSGFDTPGDSSVGYRRGAASVSGISSASMTPTPQLFQILEEQKARPQKNALFPSQNKYKMSGISTPLGGISTPLGGIATPIGGIATPIGGIATPIGGIATPLGGIATPIGGIATPLGGIATPIGGIATPIAGFSTPIEGIGTPASGLQTPGGIGTPIGGIGTPLGGIGTPHAGISTPGGISTPIGGIGTPIGGINTPGGISTPLGSGIKSSVGGISTPIGGVATPTGLTTPAGFSTPTGINTPIGGVATPTGISAGAETPGVTVNLSDKDLAEGVMTADVIRKQLQAHEAAAAKAKKQAGQSDKGEKRPADKKADKKTKKKFKF